MDDSLVSADTLRTQALSACRQLASAAAASDADLTRPQLEELFQSGEFSSCLFRLFDHASEGCLYAEEVANTVKANFRE